MNTQHLAYALMVKEIPQKLTKVLKDKVMKVFRVYGVINIKVMVSGEGGVSAIVDRGSWEEENIVVDRGLWEADVGLLEGGGIIEARVAKDVDRQTVLLVVPTHQMNSNGKIWMKTMSIPVLLRS